MTHTGNVYLTFQATTMIGPDDILICSDLDRTLIPNGFQEESAHARPVLRRLAENAHIFLAYVSGRDRELIRDAIEEFYLPEPDYAIGDVGTTLYHVSSGNWQLSRIGKDTPGKRWLNFWRMWMKSGCKSPKNRIYTN
jgi:hypothetical protein